MFTFSNAKFMVNLLSGPGTSQPFCRNDDLSHYLMRGDAEKAEAPKKRWFLGRITDQMRARAATRRYEDQLVALWESSPHLIDDIGLTLSDRAALTEDVVAVPPRVAARIAALRPTMIILPPDPIQTSASSKAIDKARKQAPLRMPSIGPIAATA